MKYYKSSDQLPGNQGGNDLGHNVADILQLPDGISPLTGLCIGIPVSSDDGGGGGGDMITSYQSPPGH